MRIEFEKMDIESMGEISLDCMKQVLTRKAVNEDGTVHEGLSEAEVEEIFDALKVGKAEPRVHWHEFLAACLPECHVDERNLRIAFDRMDVDHNGFITFEEVIQLIARDADENQDVLMKAWAESVEEYHCHMSQFSYEEFCHLVHAYL
jgi:calcium-dependent protein kinase